MGSDEVLQTALHSKLLKCSAATSLQCFSALPSPSSSSCAAAADAAPLRFIGQLLVFFFFFYFLRFFCTIFISFWLVF